MCLILIANHARDDYPLVLVANRDEFLDRPTEGLSFWKDSPNLLAGRDLQAGGTWLGMSTSGRIAAVTNFREPGNHRIQAASRGGLVTDFLESPSTLESYLRDVALRAQGYNGFNLLVWEQGQLGYYSNRDASGPRIAPQGILGLSNHLLDTPWPKVELGRQALASALDQDHVNAEALLDLGLNRMAAADSELPATGMTLEQERALSATFIRMNGYGTRSTSTILVHRSGKTDFYERSYDEAGRVHATAHYSIQLDL